MSVSSAAVPDDTDAIPPKCPEANAAAVSDDTEVVSPKCTEANAAAVPDNTEVVPPKTRRAKAIAKKLSASAPLREITVPAELPPTQDCPESSTAHTVASGLIPRFVALSPGVKPVATKKGSSSFTGKIPLCA